MDERQSTQRHFRSGGGVTDYVYRHFSEDGELLYVGVTWNVIVRSYQHSLRSRWWPLVDHIEAVAYDDRESAERAETEAIFREQPKFNRKDKERPKTPALTRAQQLLVVANCVECRIFGSRTLAKTVPDSYAFRREVYDAYLAGQIHGHPVGHGCHINVRSYNEWLDDRELAAAA